MSDTGSMIWFEIYVSDMAKAKIFYQCLFGWRLEPFEDYDRDHYFIISSDSGDHPNGALVLPPATPQLTRVPGQGGSVLYFKVESIEDAVATAERLGGRLVAPKRRIGEDGGYFGLIEDVAGNVLGLWTGS